MTTGKMWQLTARRHVDQMFCSQRVFDCSDIELRRPSPNSSTVEVRRRRKSTRPDVHLFIGAPNRMPRQGLSGLCSRRRGRKIISRGCVRNQFPYTSSQQRTRELTLFRNVLSLCVLEQSLFCRSSSDDCVYLQVSMLYLHICFVSISLSTCDTCMYL